MASKSAKGNQQKRRSSGSAVTAPKGRPTAGRGETTERRRRVTPVMEWIIAFLVISAVFVVIFLIWGDSRTATGAPDELGPMVSAAVASAIVG